MNYGLKLLNDEKHLQLSVLFREKELLLEKIKLIEKQIEITCEELKNGNK